MTRVRCLVCGFVGEAERTLYLRCPECKDYYVERL